MASNPHIKDNDEKRADFSPLTLEQRTQIEELAKEVAAVAKALAHGGTSELFCPRIWPTPVDEDRVGLPSYSIVIDTARVTERGESVRINDDLLESDALRFQFRDHIRLEIEPFIEGVGQVRVLWGESFDGIVVILNKPDNKFGERHA